MKWLLKNSLPVILAIVGTVIVMRIFSPEPERVTEYVSDVAKIATVQAERDKAISERDDWAFKFKKLIGTRIPSEPIRVISGRIERPLSFEWAQDTLKKERTLLPTMDVILYGRVEGDEISFYSANLYTEHMGGEGRKIYIWERKTNSYYFAVQDRGGILMTFTRPFLRWDGVYAGLGADFTHRAFGLLEARLVIMETLELGVYLNTQPGVGATLKMGL